MTKEMLYQTIKTKFAEVITENQLAQDPVNIICKSLTAEEAIGKTKRQDFPIITGKDIMLQAEYKGQKGQAFTDSPANFAGSLEEILALDIENDAHARGIFIATVNAVMAKLGKCEGTVHCKVEGPELCAAEMKQYLEQHYKEAKKIALIGYQPALLEMLAKSEFEVRVLDLNPANVGEERYGVQVEDGVKDKDAVIAFADIILCTGSTLCNGTIIDYMNLGKEVIFFGTTIAGCAEMLGVKRVCFAQNYC